MGLRTNVAPHTQRTVIAPDIQSKYTIDHLIISYIIKRQTVLSGCGIAPPTASRWHRAMLRRRQREQVPALCPAQDSRRLTGVAYHSRVPAWSKDNDSPMMRGLARPLVCPILVERGDEVAALGAVLGAVLDEIDAAHGRVIFVAGEAGVGKTRLTRAAMELAAGRGWRVFEARCYEQGQLLAYAPILARRHRWSAASRC